MTSAVMASLLRRSPALWAERSRYVKVAHPDGTIVKQYVVADNIVDNPVGDDGLPKPMFTYWPDVYHLRSVEVMVTVEESRGHRTARKTMIGELSLRNN